MFCEQPIATCQVTSGVKRPVNRLPDLCVTAWLAGIVKSQEHAAAVSEWCL